MTETSPSEPVALEPRAILLAERAVIAVSGPEAAHFLHNLVTANIETLKPGNGTLAALLTPQGKIAADMLIFNASDEEPLFLLDVTRGYAEELLTRLTRYKLRADITLALLPEGVAVMACLDAPPVTGEDFYTFADPRNPALGQRLIGPADTLTQATAALPRGTPEDYHRRRVALVIPEGGRDFLMLDTFPHEANFDQLGGVDFAKGCYIGQEVVSRMQHRGTTRTRAMGVRFRNGFGVTGGATISAGEKPIGKIGESFDDRAIGFVRLDRLSECADADLIQAGGVPIAIEQPQYANFVSATLP